MDDVHSKEDALILTFTAVGQVTRDRFFAPIAINTYALRAYARLGQDAFNRRPPLGTESFILSICPYAVRMNEDRNLFETGLALEELSETLDHLDTPAGELRRIFDEGQLTLKLELFAFKIIASPTVLVFSSSARLSLLSGVLFTLTCLEVLA